MLRAEDLKTEYLSQPLGIGESRPRFFWKLRGSGNQTAYRIRVQTERDGTVWDTGRVESPEFTHIRYGGRPLESRERAVWQVKVWDDREEESDWSPEAWFELGLLRKDDWDAWWIGGDYEPSRRKHRGADCFRRQFRMPVLPEKGRLYYTARGVCEVYLNGVRIGDSRLTPGWTDYNTRLYARTVDILPYLRLGTNVLEILLGEGWYRGKIGWGEKRNVYGTGTGVLAQMELVDRLGDKMTLGTDRGFGWSSDGETGTNDIRGETGYCMRKPSYSGCPRVLPWQVTPIPTAVPPIRETAVIRPMVMTTPGGRTILDFGRVLSGQLTFSGSSDAWEDAGRHSRKQRERQQKKLERAQKREERTQKRHPGRRYMQETGETEAYREYAGQIEEEGRNRPKQAEKPRIVTVRVSETLDEKGEFPKERTGLSRKLLTLTLAEGENTYRQQLSFGSFRYALVEGMGQVTGQTLCAHVLSSVVPAGEFTCSSPRLNRFEENARRTMEGAFLDVPLANPGGKALPLTGDALTFFGASLYMGDLAPFWQKWLRDVADAQRSDGRFPLAAPSGGAGLSLGWDGSPGRGEAGVLLPWQFSQWFQDDTLLMELYPSMRRYAYRLIEQAWKTPFRQKLRRPEGEEFVIDRGRSLPEPLEPMEESPEDGLRALGRHGEECTASMAAVMAVTAASAAVLGEAQDEKTFSGYAREVRAAYCRRYTRGGTVLSTRQGKLVRPIALGLLDEAGERKTLRHLVAELRKRDYAMAMGLYSAAAAPGILSRAGYGEDAIRFLLNPAEPGWQNAIDRGATTMWENWHGKDVMDRVRGSRSRYAMGAAAGWLYSDLAGIRVTGNRTFSIRPTLCGDITHVHCRVESLWGDVSIQWNRRLGGWSFEITIPAGTGAEVFLPDGSRRRLSGGAHFIGI